MQSCRRTLDWRCYYEESDDLTSLSALKLADANPAFDFLKDEPDLYGEDDVKPENRNPKHRSRLN
ncbi:MAG: hypothetical protein NZM06_05335 [Chloroherpetonaceae bacterium]|nr:hypothetical protein [Chloroherpetonaceae bacterium]MDW8438658.1 hypothetical protein [Chloroherpetonaceae bacterium]